MSASVTTLSKPRAFVAGPPREGFAPGRCASHRSERCGPLAALQERCLLLRRLCGTSSNGTVNLSVSSMTAASCSTRSGAIWATSTATARHGATMVSILGNSSTANTSFETFWRFRHQPGLSRPCSRRRLSSLRFPPLEHRARRLQGGWIRSIRRTSGPGLLPANPHRQLHGVIR